MIMPSIQIGASLTIQKKVTENETIAHYGTGQLENLLSTPALVALMQEASAQLLDPMLSDGFITVTKMVQVEHEKPSLLGSVISVKVEVSSVEDNRIALKMAAFDEFGPIGTGEHIRVAVNKSALLKRASQREQLL